MSSPRRAAMKMLGSQGMAAQMEVVDQFLSSTNSLAFLYSEADMEFVEVGRRQLPG